MIQQLQERGKLPTALRNLGATRSWRPADMVNWHRLVGPLRTLTSQESSLTLYQVLFDMCTTFEVTYEPIPVQPSPHVFRNVVAPEVGLFVDAPDHTSGVATTLRSWSQQATRRGAGLCVHYCGHHDLFPDAVRFHPAGIMSLDVYRGLTLCMPSVHEVLRRFQMASPKVVHLSTPGPMGLLGLIAARKAGIPVVGTFHTDFPAYATKLSGDSQMEATSWRFMRWFYGQMDRVAAPSTDIRRKLIHQGIPPERIQIVGRGVNTGAFSPAFRDPALRRQWGGDEIRHWLLYVGRVSLEKNLPVLAQAFRQIAAKRKDVGLVVVGEGPYLNDIRAATAGLPVTFAGMRCGEDLARHYASSDLFVFPSLTDTLGVVLLEAQASGLPVLVSSEGGPKDCVIEGVTGHIVEPMNPTLLARHIEHVLSDDLARLKMGEEARRWAVQQTPERSFEAFWNLHQPHLSTKRETARHEGACP